MPGGWPARYPKGDPVHRWIWQNQRVLYGWGTAVFTFLLYYLTLAPDLTWQAGSGDGGELITAAVTLGIPHPPGYPTYVLLGKAVSYLPFEPVAYRFHLFSALCMALAAALVTIVAHRIIVWDEGQAPGPLALVPGTLFAFSPLIWDQAIVAEVYSLNLLMVAAFLWVLLGKRPSIHIGIFLGLCLTTHLTSLFLLPMALGFTPTRAWLKLAVGTFIGASPYLLLPFLARLSSPVIWGDATTLAGWWWIVSGQIYQANQFALPLDEFWQRLTSWTSAFVRQLGIAGWPVLVLAGWRVRNNPFPVQKIWWGLLATAAFYLVYAFFYNTQDAIVLTLPALLMVSLCLSPALCLLKKWAYILPGLTLLLHLLSQNGAVIHNVRQEAENILEPAPPSAILLTSGDPDIFALWYFHFVEGQRPDLFLVDDRLFAFVWYRHNLAQQYPTLRALNENNLAQFQASNQPHHALCRVRFVLEESNDTAISCLQDR